MLMPTLLLNCEKEQLVTCIHSFIRAFIYYCSHYCRMQTLSLSTAYVGQLPCVCVSLYNTDNIHISMHEEPTLGFTNLQKEKWCVTDPKSNTQTRMLLLVQWNLLFFYVRMWRVMRLLYLTMLRLKKDKLVGVNFLYFEKKEKKEWVQHLNPYMWVQQSFSCLYMYIYE